MWPAEGRRYHCSGAGSASIQAAVRTSGAAMAMATVATVASATRLVTPTPAPHSKAAAIRAGPITLSTSTFNRSTGDPSPSTKLWKRKTNASPKMVRPRHASPRQTSARARPRACLAAPDSAEPTPARKRNAGAARPPANVAQ